MLKYLAEVVKIERTTPSSDGDDLAKVTMKLDGPGLYPGSEMIGVMLEAHACEFHLGTCVDVYSQQSVRSK